MGEDEAGTLQTLKGHRQVMCSLVEKHQGRVVDTRGDNLSESVRVYRVVLEPDPKQEYFTDGFTEQIITSLSKIPALFVISRNSTFSYKGKPVKVQQVGEELGVRYVLEGSVQKTSRRIRINVQFIDAISGQHLWAESYDRDLKDIFSLQDEVILKITSELAVNLTAGEQAHSWAEGTKSLEAYLKLMQGREYRYKGNRESIALARRMAEEAIALDPKYAEAYASLGTTHYLEVFLGTSRPKDSIARATELMQKALALNGSLADAHSMLGVLYSWSSTPIRVRRIII